MEPTVFRFTLRHSLRQQVLLTLLIVASYPFLYLALELPKRIVDDAIGGAGTFPVEVFGVPLEQVPYLMALSFAFLALVVLNGLFKYFINTSKGRLNERMLRRLRYELYARVLRFPLPHFRRVSGGEIIPMITAETDPIGNFIGEAFATPLQQGGMLVVYLAFIFAQDPVLGAAAVALYPFQAWLIPRLQRRVNQLSKQRVRLMRGIADRIGESVSGIQEIRANDTAAWHLADLTGRLGEVYEVRFKIYQRKFFIKFLNNFINQLTPFFFYSIGGYLVITGSITFGALVAVLAAYKDLAAPWKELLDWYQLKEDVRVKYDQVIEQFHPDGMLEMRALTDDAVEVVRLDGDVELSGVSVVDDVGHKLLDGVSLTVGPEEHVAVAGAGGGGAGELAMVLGGLMPPTLGQVRAGGRDLYALGPAVLGRRVAYAGGAAHLMTGTLRENLLYGLQHRPLRQPIYAGEALKAFKRRRAETLRSGNLDLDPGADWIDYEAAGCTDERSLRRRMLRVVDLVDLTADVYALGLHGTLDPERFPEAAETVLLARRAVREELSDPGLADLVEPFDPDRYNTNASVAENLLFGTPLDPGLMSDRVAAHPYVRRVLDRAGLTEDFVRIGLQVAETMVELFADLPPGHEFFEQFSFIHADDLPAYQPILQKVARDGQRALSPADRELLLQLPFRLIPARHRLGLIDRPMETRILEARRIFFRDFPDEMRGQIEFFDAARYNRAGSLMDNILFGKTSYGTPQVTARVHGLVSSVVERFDLRDTVVAVGLDRPVGVAGSRLSMAQRQKVILGRCLMKNPDLMVVNEATGALDGASQAVVHTNVVEAMRGRRLVWVVHRPSLARMFDRVVVMRDGRVAEDGTYAALDRPGTALAEMLELE